MSAIKDISKIDFNKVKWITNLRNKLCENGQISESDIDDAFNDILSNEKLEIEPNIPELRLVKSKKKAIHKLYNNNNVAGLQDNQEITFSPIFTLIFGLNGTGKTSYYRILKDAFYAKQPLKPNIYSDKKEITAKIDIANSKELIYYQRKNREEELKSIETIEWEAGQHFKKSIKFCDESILSKSLSYKEAEWNLDKYKLDYYDKLKNSVEKVNQRVNLKIQTLSSSIQSNLKTLLNGLSDKTEESIFIKLNNFSKDIYSNSNQIETILKNINSEEIPNDIETLKQNAENEASKNVKDLYTEIDNLKNHKTIIVNLIKYIERSKKLIESVNKGNELIQRLQELENSRDFTHLEKYNLLFSPIKNDKPDQDYIDLIKKIAEIAIKSEINDYPKNVEKCFYCNQDLPDKNKELILKIHQLVDNDLETKIEQRKNKIKEYLVKLNKHIRYEIDNFNGLKIKFVKNIFNIKTKNEINIEELIKSSIKKDILTSIYDSYKKPETFNENITKYIDNNLLLLEILKTELFLSNQKITVKTKYISELEENKKKARKKLNLLLDKLYFDSSTEIITNLISNLTIFQKYNNLSFQGIKTKITTSKANTEKYLLRNNYQDIFSENLKYFEIPIKDKIKRTFKTPSGVSHIDTKIEVGVNSYPTKEILSEGEAKISALCDWLTELEFDDIDTLIFDDPITSLDHRYISKFSKKILELSEKYQVIVFTHNSEFYQELITKTIGNNEVYNPTCGLCEDNEGKNQCIGKKNNTVYKCGEYYKVERAVKPGLIKNEIEFFRFNYRQRLEKIRNDLINGNIDNVGTQLRVTINNFYEKYVLGDIKKEVFKGQELIYHKKDFKVFSDEDYEEIYSIHNKLSSSGTVHEASIENKTQLDNKAYIDLYNKFVTVINKQNGLKKIELIEEE